MEEFEMNQLTDFFAKFWNDEEGLQTLEMMLIIAVIVVIALAFRTQIKEWVQNLLDFGSSKVSEFQE